ncbi:hypothetical protein ACWDUL_38550, partial [Nocardia niigatensis]
PGPRYGLPIRDISTRLPGRQDSGDSPGGDRRDGGLHHHQQVRVLGRAQSSSIGPASGWRTVMAAGRNRRTGYSDHHRRNSGPATDNPDTVRRGEDHRGDAHRN